MMSTYWLAAEVSDAGPRHRALARRLGFTLGADWAMVRHVLRAARADFAGCFLRWDRGDRCWSIVGTATLKGAIRSMAVNVTLDV